MRIAVTGHRGYLGQILTSRLLGRGHRVLGYDTALFELDKPIRKVQDIRKAQISSEADLVVHLAAIVGEPACKAYYELAKSVNLMGTQCVIEQCKKLDVPLIFASTCSVYGAKDQVLFEDSETRPLGPYARYRLAAENDVIKANGAVLRFGTLFGWSPRMRFDLVVNGWSRDVHLGKAITVEGGKQWRPFTHVQDAAGAVLSVMDAIIDGHEIGGEIFNVAGVNSAIIELANTFRNLTGCKVEVNSGVSDMRNYRVNSEKLEGIGWEAKFDLEHGITEIMAMLKVLRGDLFDPKFSNIEALKQRFPGKSC